MAWYSDKNQVESSFTDTDPRSMENWLKSEKVQKVFSTTLVSDGPNCWRVEIPTKEVIGQIIRLGNLSRSTLDAGRMQMYADSVHGSDKKLKSRQERNYQYQYVDIYTTDDEEETPDLIRFVMKMNHWEYDSSKGRQKLIYYYYTSDYGYVDEDEFKSVHVMAELKQDSAMPCPTISIEKMASHFMLKYFDIVK